MSKFKVLILFFFLTQNMFGTFLPKQTYRAICDELSTKESSCSNSKLKVDSYFLMDNNKVLIFVYLKPNKSDIIENIYGIYPKIPVTFDERKHFKVSKLNPLFSKLNIKNIIKAPDGSILLDSAWEIEGVQHSLALSHDGINWKTIDMVDGKDWCCFKMIEKICFSHSKLLLFMNNYSSSSGEYEAFYFENAYPKLNKFKTIEASNFKKNCKSIAIIDNQWKVKKLKNQLIFSHPKSKQPLEL